MIGQPIQVLRKKLLAYHLRAGEHERMRKLSLLQELLRILLLLFKANDRPGHTEIITDTIVKTTQRFSLGRHASRRVRRQFLLELRLVLAPSSSVSLPEKTWRPSSHSPNNYEKENRQTQRPGGKLPFLTLPDFGATSGVRPAFDPIL